MNEETTHIIMAVFDGQERAEEAIEKSPKRDRSVVSAIIMRKDADEHTTFEDVGRTPLRGTINGIILGGVVGLVTGGTGLALGALGGVVGHHATKKKQVGNLIPDHLGKVAGSLGPNTSAILAVVKGDPREDVLAMIREMGGDIFEAEVPPVASEQMDEQADAAYTALLTALADKTGGEAKIAVPYPRIFIVINPVSGKDQPILNVLNDTFNRHGVYWDISITKQYGDATEFARQAAANGYDLVAGYGGDGTQHEVANGIMGTGVTMGVLPGGTGNGFGTELGIPNELRAAVDLLCKSYNRRKIDIAQTDDGYFIQRLFTGIEPEEQTSREEKNKYGTLAYLVRDVKRASEVKDMPYRLKIDGEVIDIAGYKCYVVNSGKAGTGLSISQKFSVDDGYLDVFMLSRNRQSSTAALDRFFNLDTRNSGMYYWRGQNIEIDVDPDQPVWTDGEYTGRTPTTISVIPGGLTVAVP